MTWKKRVQIMEKKKIFAQCHYGFNMMRDTTCIGLTMKSLDYFAYDIPLINSVPADTWKMVEENKLGFNVITASDVTEKILSTAEEDYMAMRKNVIDYYYANFTDDAFRKSLTSWIDS